MPNFFSKRPRLRAPIPAEQMFSSKDKLRLVLSVQLLYVIRTRNNHDVVEQILV